MKRSDFTLLDSEEPMIGLLRKYGLYREDDVVFDAFDDGTMAVFTGDDFVLDVELLESMELSALLIIGSVTVEFLAVSNVIGDFGIFCITGDLTCRNLYNMTECTWLVVGGDLTVHNALYSDCGNSGIQVNGDLRIGLHVNVQSDLEVQGEQIIAVEDPTQADLAARGIHPLPEERPADAVKRFMDTLKGTQPSP